jgi:HEAT repeat protein
MAKLKRHLVVASVTFLCVSIAAIFSIQKYRDNGSQDTRNKPSETSDAAPFEKPSPLQVQAESSSSPLPASAANSVSRQQSLMITQDNRTDRPEMKTPLSTDQKTEADKDAAVSKVLGALIRQSTNLSAEERAKKLALVLDRGALLKDRREAAWILAKGGDAETLSALRQILADPAAAPDLKAAIIEGLAYSNYPQKKEVFLSALAEKNEVVARAAIKGLSSIGDQESVDILSGIAGSPDEPGILVSEAIAGLGKISNPLAYQTLVDLYNESAGKDNSDSDSRQEIIAALGQRNISETGEFFDQILKGKDSNPELRVAVAQSLEETQGDVSPFLINMLHDENGEVRAAAAWTLAAREEPGNIAREAEAILQKEPDAKVRTRLYQALGNQENVDIGAVFPAISNESDPDARAAGYDLLAKNIGTLKNTDLKERFENAIVPELKQSALTADKLNSRLSAIITLRRANTEQSRRALEEIAAQSKDNRILEATGMVK